LANAQRQALLALCRRLLFLATLAAPLPSPEVVPIEPAQPRFCRSCGGTRLVYRELSPAAPPDSS